MQLINVISSTAIDGYATQMSYKFPRGPCRQTSTILSSRCPCLRFMIHPSAASNSFSCDGCGHHASFHEMRSESEEYVQGRWTREDGTFDRDAYEADEEVQEVMAKRRRLGYMKPMYSSGDLTMPHKAQSTLVDGPQKKRKGQTKTFDDLDSS